MVETPETESVNWYIALRERIATVSLVTHRPCKAACQALKPSHLLFCKPQTCEYAYAK